MGDSITATFHDGDKVIATCGPKGFETERTGVVICAKGDGYLVEVDFLGGKNSFIVAPEKIRFKDPIKLAEADEANEQEEAERILRQAKEKADPPKKERIRRTKEEIALGIPPDQILAYRADPDSWNKRAADPDFLTQEEEDAIQEEAAEHLRKSDLALQKIRTKGDAEEEAYNALKEKADKWDALQRASGGEDHNQTIEKALDDYWEDKVAEYLAPPADPEQTFFQELGEELNPPTLKAGGEVITVSNYKEGDPLVTIAAKQFDGHVSVPFCQVVKDSDLAKEEVQPDWAKCMKAVRDEMDQFGPRPDVKFIQTTKVNGERLYVTIEPDSPLPQFYPSATNIVGTTMRTDEEILKWMVDKFRTYEEYKEEMNVLAAKGSVMHGLFADAINAVMSKIGLPKYTEYEKWASYFNVAWARQGYPHLAARWHKWMLKALQAFMQWVIDYEVEFIAVEIPMRSKRMGVAGQIDVVCSMLDAPRKTSRSDEERDLGKRTQTALESGRKKGLEGDALAAHVLKAANRPYKPREPKRVLALVDFKSGGAKESHYPQMGVYMEMVKENYPALIQKLHHAFVWAPVKTGWKVKPTYIFKDVSKQVGIYMQRQLPQMIHLAKERAVDMSKETVLVMEGEAELGRMPEFRHVPLAEYWMERIQANDFGERDLEISENAEEEEDDADE